MRAQLMMGLIAAGLVAAGLAFTAPAFSAETAQQTGMKTCAANWNAMSAAAKAKTKYTDYIGTCMKGGSAAPAAKATATAAASAGGGKAKCNDGTVVTYKSRSGTCSGHKGVASWM